MNAKTHNRTARAIVVTKHAQNGKIIARAEVNTLEGARLFLDSLNDDGSVRPGSAAAVVPMKRQATPCQQQQANAAQHDMNDIAEQFMAEARVRLGMAVLCERFREWELAAAYGAEAANKLAQAIRLDQRMAVVVPMVRP